MHALIRHCTQCGARVGLIVPAGDNRERHVCPECGLIQYVNPRIVVGAVGTWDGQVLLCKRAIEPRAGFWTVPAGFLEFGESPEAGAIRETLEEACAAVEILALLGSYSVPSIGQVHLMFAARLLAPECAIGSETLETRLVPWIEIPWDELAFPSVRWALDTYREYAAAHEAWRARATSFPAG